MTRSRVTLTLSTEKLEELRDLVGARSLSAAVDQAIAMHLDRVRHLAVVDAWLVDLERAHGPIPPAALEWAATVVDGWETSEAAAQTVENPPDPQLR